MYLLAYSSLSSAYQTGGTAAGQSVPSDEQVPLGSAHISINRSGPSSVRDSDDSVDSAIAANTHGRSNDRDPSHSARVHIVASNTDSFPARERTHLSPRETESGTSPPEAGANALKLPTDPVSNGEDRDSREDEEDDGGGRRDMLSGIGGVLSREVSSGQESVTEGRTIDELFSTDGERDPSENSSIGKTEEDETETDLDPASGDKKAGLEDMVRSLQAQVEESQTSQARTR